MFRPIRKLSTNESSLNVNEMKKCAALTNKRSRCKNFSLSGEKYCNVHLTRRDKKEKDEIKWDLFIGTLKRAYSAYIIASFAVLAFAFSFVPPSMHNKYILASVELNNLEIAITEMLDRDINFDNICKSHQYFVHQTLVRDSLSNVIMPPNYLCKIEGYAPLTKTLKEINYYKNNKELYQELIKNMKLSDLSAQISRVLNGSIGIISPDSVSLTEEINRVLKKNKGFVLTSYEWEECRPSNSIYKIFNNLPASGQSGFNVAVEQTYPVTICLMSADHSVELKYDAKYHEIENDANAFIKDVLLRHEIIEDLNDRGVLSNAMMIEPSISKFSYQVAQKYLQEINKIPNEAALVIFGIKVEGEFVSSAGKFAIVLTYLFFMCHLINFNFLLGRFTFPRNFYYPWFFLFPQKYIRYLNILLISVSPCLIIILIDSELENLSIISVLLSMLLVWLGTFAYMIYTSLLRRVEY